MTTFNADALWAKSRAFIERALRARDRQDDLEYHLWAAVSLELVGKAALARISPALVCDPDHFGSLLFACGGKEPADKKSIQARTVFERLTHVLSDFDVKMKEQCIGIASRRNAELHSGESPIVGLDPRAWVPTFWKCAAAIVTGQGQTLDDWVGAAEGARIAELLTDASRLLEHTVQARIERMRVEYDKRFPPHSRERTDAKARADARSAPQRAVIRADAVEEHPCPACDSKAWLLGWETGEDVDGPHYEQDSYDFHDTYAYEVVTTHYSADEFRCFECGLQLEGREEMTIADLPEEFDREETREPRYEEDYGNC